MCEPVPSKGLFEWISVLKEISNVVCLEGFLGLSEVLKPFWGNKKGSCLNCIGEIMVLDGVV